MERATGCAKGSLNDTTVQLCSILGGDTGAISALRILHLYMERLGCDFQVSSTPLPLMAEDALGRQVPGRAYLRVAPTLTGILGCIRLLNHALLCPC